MKKTLSFFLSFFIVVLGSAINTGIVEKPDNEKLVVDYANFLDANTIATLEKKLEDFSNETSTQIAIVTIDSLNGYDINDYAVRLLTRWGLGQKGKDNGILILIKPKTSEEKREIAISVGYGLEGVVPDAVAKRIIEKEIIPLFKKGQYGNGLEKAVNILMDLTKGEYTGDAYMKKTEKNITWRTLVLIFISLIWIFPVFFQKRAHSIGRKGTSTSTVWGILHTILYISSSSLGSGGGFGGSSSRSSGGFGGFGGGLGGGGGASGSW